MKTYRVQHNGDGDFTVFVKNMTYKVYSKISDKCMTSGHYHYEDEKEKEYYLDKSKMDKLIIALTEEGYTKNN